MKKIFSTFKNIVYVLIFFLLCIFVLNLLNPIWWQNIKLQTSPFWGHFTIQNNPLLSKSDSDLKDINKNEQRIDLNILFSGGPPKDGIPSIDNPKYEPIQKTNFKDDELIIGVSINGIARAYPYAILNWHEIVNDRLAGVPISITYCPLCETNSVFIRKIDGKEVEFGVSGKLYQSCLVMYDRLTDSLYYQPWGVGIVGEKVNYVLERIDGIRTTVGEWKNKYPNSTILTTETGFNRNYSGYPYGTYYTDKSIIFPIKNKDSVAKHSNPKEINQIIFVHSSEFPFDTFGGEYVSFSQGEVRSKNKITFDWEGKRAVAKWDTELNTIQFKDENEKIIPSMALFYFVIPSSFSKEK